MNKPGELRAVIEAAAPNLVTDPDKFLVFVEQGNLVATNTASLSFEYRYTLQLVLLDFAGNADTIMIALLGWVKANQPELLDNVDKRATAISFEVEHLNQTTCDLSIKLPLTEAVKVTLQPDGSRVAAHLPEPRPEWLSANLAGT